MEIKGSWCLITPNNGNGTANTRGKSDEDAGGLNNCFLRIGGNCLYLWQEWLLDK